MELGAKKSVPTINQFGHVSPDETTSGEASAKNPSYPISFFDSCHCFAAALATLNVSTHAQTRGNGIMVLVGVRS